MDKAVKLIIWSAVLTGAVAGPAAGQALADPTRPPPSMLRPAAGAAAASVAPAPAAPVLQSVLIGRGTGGRHVAVIDGETVALGGMFRGAVLVRMTETEVELQRGRQRQVLKLFAGHGGKAPPGGRP